MLACAAEVVMSKWSSWQHAISHGGCRRFGAHLAPSDFMKPRFLNMFFGLEKLQNTVTHHDQPACATLCGSRRPHWPSQWCCSSRKSSSTTHDTSFTTPILSNIVYARVRGLALTRWCDQKLTQLTFVFFWGRVLKRLSTYFVAVESLQHSCKFYNPCHASYRKTNKGH